MARKPRVEFDGAFYHAILRGNQRQRNFHDDRDRQSYLVPLEHYRQWIALGRGHPLAGGSSKYRHSCAEEFFSCCINWSAFDRAQVTRPCSLFGRCRILFRTGLGRRLISLRLNRHQIQGDGVFL
jgi:hypothetical protein